MSKVHPLKRAYMAGVFDARAQIPRDGTLIRFESVHEDMMKKFAEYAGDIGVLTERDARTCTHPIWLYRTQNMDDTRELLLLISPFLSAKRLTQASAMIAKIERNASWQKKHPEKVTSSVT